MNRKRNFIYPTVCQTEFQAPSELEDDMDELKRFNQVELSSGGSEEQQIEYPSM